MSVYVLFLVASLRRASVWRNGLFITKFAVALVFVWFVEILFFLFCSLRVYFFLGRKALKLSSNFFFFFLDVILMSAVKSLQNAFHLRP